MNLKPGDSVYFPENLALGLLIERYAASDGHILWSYALRSPSLGEPGSARMMVSIQHKEENAILESIESGRLEYYEAA